MAKIDVSEEQKKALSDIEQGVKIASIYNKFIESDESLEIAVIATAGGKGNKDLQIAITDERDKVIAVLSRQKKKHAAGIVTLAKKHGIALEDEEKAILGTN